MSDDDSKVTEGRFQRLSKNARRELIEGELLRRQRLGSQPVAAEAVAQFEPAFPGQQQYQQPQQQQQQEQQQQQWEQEKAWRPRKSHP